MNSLPDNHFLLIGLPSTGKTSFLAALWYMLCQQSAQCGLTLERLDGDSQYLNRIRDAWARYKPVPRNKADSLKKVSMLLRNRETGQRARLGFPDLSGEAFRSQWTQRELDDDYDSSLREATGGLLFLSPESIKKPHRIDTVNSLLAEMGKDDGNPGAHAPAKPWNSEEAPTQAQLVDILQMMASRDYFHRPFRLAVLVSAWDRVLPNSRRPTEWLSVELPLLKQFFESNQESFDTSYWGVSAQGGRYALPHFWEGNFTNCQAFAARLCSKSDPISAWVWEQLEPSTHAVLESIRTGTATTDSDRRTLASELNRLMGQSNLYDETRFQEVIIREETADLLNRGALQQEDEKLYLVRLLLEDAYPGELSRERQYSNDASTLQRKAPASRILLVGDSVKVSHDITEPVQWLMR